MVRDRGFEPLTPSVSRKCSTPELTAPGELTPDNFFSSSAMLEIIAEDRPSRKLILDRSVRRNVRRTEVF